MFLKTNAYLKMTKCKQCNKDVTNPLFIPYDYYFPVEEVVKETLCKNEVMLKVALPRKMIGKATAKDNVLYLDPNHAKFNNHNFCSQTCINIWLDENCNDYFFHKSSIILKNYL